MKWQFIRPFSVPPGYQALTLRTSGNGRLRRPRQGPEQLKRKWGEYSFRISMKEGFRVSNWEAKGTWGTAVTLGLQSKGRLYGLIYLLEGALRGSWQLVPSSELLAQPRTQQAQLRTQGVSREVGGKALVLPRPGRRSPRGRDWEQGFLQILYLRQTLGAKISTGRD